MPTIPVKQHELARLCSENLRLKIELARAERDREWLYCIESYPDFEETAVYRWAIANRASFED